MTPVQTQYIVDDQQVRKAVVVPVEEWERILEELEELDDIRAYDEAKAGPQDAIPFDQLVPRVVGRSPDLPTGLTVGLNELMRDDPLPRGKGRPSVGLVVGSGDPPTTELGSLQAKA